MESSLRLAACALLTAALLTCLESLNPADFPSALRADVETVGAVWARYPNDASVLYQVAALHARAGHREGALAALRRMVATGAGLHPRNRDGFASLVGDPEYQKLIAEIQRQNPPVSNVRLAFELPEGDLLPEGIAYSARTGSLYVGSAKRKIVAIAKDGAVHDFVPSGTGGLNTVIGLRVNDRRGELWAISNAIGPAPNDGVIGVFRFRLSNAALLRAYPIPAGAADLLNDLAVAPDGRVYITATNAGTVLRLDPQTGHLETFVKSLPDPNGIAVTPDAKYLFVAGWYSISRISLKDGAVTILRKPDSIADGCFDGLYWAGHRRLVGIQNCVHEGGRVLQLNLNQSLDEVKSAEVLESYNPLFEGITTGALAGRSFYFMANTQLHKLRSDGVAVGPFQPLKILRLELP